MTLLSEEISQLVDTPSETHVQCSNCGFDTDTHLLTSLPAMGRLSLRLERSLKWPLLISSSFEGIFSAPTVSFTSSSDMVKKAVAVAFTQRLEKRLKLYICCHPRNLSILKGSKWSIDLSITGSGNETPYMKRRETKHQPGRASCSQQLGHRSISLHFL